MHEFLRETCALPIEAKLNGISCCCCRRCLCLLCLNARFWQRGRSAEEGWMEKSKKSSSSTTWQGLCLAGKKEATLLFYAKGHEHS